jgi:hypothetical protein
MKSAGSLAYSSLSTNLWIIIISVDCRGVMMFNATFNNISVISWRSVLYLEETGVPGENHRPVTLYKINIRL